MRARKAPCDAIWRRCEASRNAAKTQLNTKSNLTLARQAIGIDTDALAKAQAAKGGKKAE
jgi:peptidyl-prolyl cis-trans isomerase D